jgi:hypothetical protein
VVGTRYIVTLSHSVTGRPSLRGILGEFPGVSLLRADDEHAVVSMDSPTAERLQHSYPFLELEADVRHQRLSGSL